MTTAAAAVIDLQEFRERRGMRREAPVAPVARAPALAPFWVVWVPVWPVR